MSQPVSYEISLLDHSFIVNGVHMTLEEIDKNESHPIYSMLSPDQAWKIAKHVAYMKGFKDSANLFEE